MYVYVYAIVCRCYGTKYVHPHYHLLCNAANDMYNATRTFLPALIENDEYFPNRKTIVML